jgi:hypothetical protein
MTSKIEIEQGFFTPSNKPESSLSQIYGHTDNRMPCLAVVSKDGQQIGPWIKCKDYIQDVVWSCRTKRDFSCHGFKRDIGDPEITPDGLTIAVRWLGKTVEELTGLQANSIATITALEAAARLPEGQETKFSQVIMGSDNHPYFIVFMAPAWTRNTPSITCFVSCMRLGLINKERTLQSLPTSEMEGVTMGNDSRYVGSGKTFIDRITADGIMSVPEQKWKTFKSAYNIHGSGFANFSYWKPAVEIANE